MAVNVEMIKELREKTGSGMMDCKKALVETDNDIEKAVAWLREKGITAAEKKANRVAAEGIVDAYIHAAGRVGVLVEVNVETDFAARSEVFRKMVREIAMQIAAMKPTWVDKADIPADVLTCQRETFFEQARSEGKPDKIIEKIVDGRMAKFYEASCLLEQPYIREDTKNVGTFVKEMIATIGEKISVRRFVRYEMGEGLQKKEENFVEEVMKQIR
jgi:elongation factor Ts